jgi:hypothetical protein
MYTYTQSWYIRTYSVNCESMTVIIELQPRHDLISYLLSFYQQKTQVRLCVYVCLCVCLCFFLVFYLFVCVCLFVYLFICVLVLCIIYESRAPPHHDLFSLLLSFYQQYVCVYMYIYVCVWYMKAWAFVSRLFNGVPVVIWKKRRLKAVGQLPIILQVAVV